VFVSTPKVSAAEATVRVEITLTNETDRPREISVQTTLLAPNGQTVTVMELSAAVGAGAAEKLQPQMVLSPPQLWNLESPARYRAVISKSGRMASCWMNRPLPSASATPILKPPPVSG
jgi:beta-galactosidase